MTTNPYKSPEEAGATARWAPSAFKVIVGLGVLGILIALLIPANRGGRGVARRAQCTNNLKQIALALRNYETHFHTFPPAYIADANGNRLHSWRALILPYLDRNDVYKKIDFSKPWNDPANKAAFDTNVPAYLCPSVDIPPGHTTYLAVVAPDGVFQGTTGRTLREITDGHSSTLLVAEVEAARHVHWMSPEDADMDWLLRLGEIEELPHDGVNVVWLDVHATRVDAETSKEKLRAVVSIAGNDDDVAGKTD